VRVSNALLRPTAAMPADAPPQIAAPAPEAGRARRTRRRRRPTGWVADRIGAPGREPRDAGRGAQGASGAADDMMSGRTHGPAVTGAPPVMTARRPQNAPHAFPAGQPCARRTSAAARREPAADRGAFDVEIARRGGEFTISGAGAAPRAPAEALPAAFMRRRKATVGRRHPVGASSEITSQVHRHAEAAPAASDDLPALRTRMARPASAQPNQVAYLKDIQAHDITFGHRPGGHGQDLPRGRLRRRLARAGCGEAHRAGPSRRSRPASGWASCRAISRRRSTRTSARSTIAVRPDGLRQVGKLFERKKQAIEVAPLRLHRGRTLNHSFIILDEAQNTTPEQIEDVPDPHRLGTKAVITGDVTQIASRADRSPD